MSFSTPITVRAASLTLTGSLAVVLGTVSSDAANATTGAVKVGAAGLSAVRLVGTYTRHVSSTTGRPRFALDVSMDAASTDPASVANFVPVMLLDSSSFSSGAIDAYAMQVGFAPSASGSTTQGTPPFDVRGANWFRVRALDVDAANPGTLSALAFGGVT